MDDMQSLPRKALQLRPQDRFLLIDGLIRSLDEPDKAIDAIWAEEAERRLHAHRAGKRRGISLEQAFGEERRE